jgi:hypothetical protein
MRIAAGRDIAGPSVSCTSGAAAPMALDACACVLQPDRHARRVGAGVREFCGNACDTRKSNRYGENRINERTNFKQIVLRLLLMGWWALSAALVVRVASGAGALGMRRRWA